MHLHVARNTGHSSNIGPQEFPSIKDVRYRSMIMIINLVAIKLEDLFMEINILCISDIQKQIVMTCFV